MTYLAGVSPSSDPPGYRWDNERVVFTIGALNNVLTVLNIDDTLHPSGVPYQFGSAHVWGPLTEDVKAAVRDVAGASIPQSAYGTASGVYRNREPGDPPGSVGIDLEGFTVEGERQGPIFEAPSLDPERIRGVRGMLYLLGGRQLAFNAEENDPLHSNQGELLVEGGAAAAEAELLAFLAEYPNQVGGAVWAIVSGDVRQAPWTTDPSAKLLDLSAWELLEPVSLLVAPEPVVPDDGTTTILGPGAGYPTTGVPSSGSPGPSPGGARGGGGGGAPGGLEPPAGELAPRTALLVGAGALALVFLATSREREG